MTGNVRITADPHGGWGVDVWLDHPGAHIHGYHTMTRWGARAWAKDELRRLKQRRDRSAVPCVQYEVKP